jgi:hypothetical protein
MFLNSVVYLALACALTKCAMTKTITFHNRYSSVFFQNQHKLLQKLPTIKILDLPSKYNVDVPNYKNKTVFEMENFAYHEHDLKFILWLKLFYSKTVQSSDNADLYYLHIFHESEVPLPIEWWVGIDNELQKVSENTPPIGFQMEKVVLVTTHPLTWVRDLDPSLRHLFDIRFVRVDPECEFNGREVFVPYVEPRSHWKHNFTNSIRKNFIAAACRNALGNMDIQRQWRYKLFVFWHNVPNCIISRRLNVTEFDKAYLETDFCAILPGDTTSTAKLYKAIFAGCIPVVFLSFPSELPFFHFVDWSQFSIIVAKDILNSAVSMEELLIYLQNIRNDSVLLAKYKQNLEDVSILFDYAKSSWPSVYHLTLLELTRHKPTASIEKTPGILNLLHKDLSLKSFILDN